MQKDKRKITLIPGDGIGPEICEAMKKVVSAAGVEIKWEECLAGDIAFKQLGTPLPEETICSIRKNKIAIKGPTQTPIGKGFRSANVLLRQKLDLYQNIRPCSSYSIKGKKTKEFNIVVFRENLEDLYCGIEFKNGAKDTSALINFVRGDLGLKIKKDSGISFKCISRSECKRIIKSAANYALLNKNKKITFAHKANILKYTDGIFLSEAKSLEKIYTQLDFEYLLIDNLCLQLVTNPSKFQVIVAPNLYGDIISELCSGLTGGLGLSPSINKGDKYVVFEPVHGSAPDIAGRGIANPIAMILCGALLLEQTGKKIEAGKIKKAVAHYLKSASKLPIDLTNSKERFATTKEIVEGIIKKL